MKMFLRPRFSDALLSLPRSALTRPHAPPMHFVLKTRPSLTNFFIRIFFFFFKSRRRPLTPISAVQLPTKDAMMTEGKGLVYNSADWSPATSSGCYYLSITVMCGRYQGPFSTCLLLCSPAACCQRSQCVARSSRKE